MSCNLCIVVYNIYPVGLKALETRDIAMHSKLKHPFTNPFVVGPVNNPLFHQMANPKLCGSFSGMQGDFLVHSENNILVLQPKDDISITYGNTLFANGESHILHVPTPKKNSFKITTGSVIVGLVDAQNGTRKLNSAALFLSMDEDDLNKFDGFLLSSIAHFLKMWEISMGDIPKFATFTDHPDITGFLLKPMVCCESPRAITRAVGEKSAAKGDWTAGQSKSRKVAEVEKP